MTALAGFCQAASRTEYLSLNFSSTNTILKNNCYPRAHQHKEIFYTLFGEDNSRQEFEI